jgi:hypothetical protein
VSHHGVSDVTRTKPTDVSKSSFRGVALPFAPAANKAIDAYLCSKGS